MAYVYVLKSRRTNRYYVGSTQDLEKRLTEHNDSTSNPSRWTRGGGPWVLVFSVEFATVEDALRAETFIKRMKSRAFIEKLISGERDIKACLRNLS